MIQIIILLGILAASLLTCLAVYLIFNTVNRKVRVFINHRHPARFKGDYIKDEKNGSN